MKLTIEKKALVEALNIATKAIQKSSVAIMEAVDICAGSDRVTFTGVNTTMEVKTFVPNSILDTDAQVETTGSARVPGKKFTDIVKKLPNGKVDLELKDDVLLVKRGKTKCEINVVEGEFPTRKPFNPLVNIYVIGADLHQALGVEYAAAKEAVRPALLGVRMEIGEQGLIAVATDSFRLALKNVAEVEGEKPTNLNTCLPRAEDIDTAMSLLPDDEEIRVMANESEVCFMTDLIQIRMLQLDQTFPDYQRIIPNPDKAVCKVSVNRGELKETLERAMIVAAGNDNNLVKFHLSNGLMKVSAVCAGIGSMTESLEVSLTGDDLDISVNAKYLIESLSVTTVEDVTINFYGNMQPFTFEVENETHLILPLRVM